MEISGRFVGLFSRNGVFFSKFGENYRFWVRIGFLGGFINMHSFFVFLFGNNRFLDTISILIPSLIIGKLLEIQMGFLCPIFAS